MKWIENIFRRVHPLFSPGGRFERLFPLFEATEAFLMTPGKATDGPPHVRDALDMKRVMMMVVVALIPCTLFGIFNAGYMYDAVNQVPGATWATHWIRGARIVLPIIFVSYLVGGLWEVLFAIVRRHEISEGFLVTGLLFPLTLPPTIPLWQVAVGVSFGIVIGKEIFGGVGFNLLNPALAARCFLYFAYPAQISGDGVWVKVADAANTAQGYTGATALAVAKNAPAGATVVETLRQAGYTLKSMIVGLEGGSIGETSMLAVLAGAAILLLTGIGAWRIMLSCVLGGIVVTLLARLLPADVLAARPGYGLPFYYDLAMGGSLFGYVFMATDPVSAAATKPGKWVYGFLIGALTVTIRLFNPAYTAGNMLSILFMNVMAPLIDHVVVQAHIRGRARRAEARRRAA